MKKLITILLALSLIFCLAACGGGGSTSQGSEQAQGNSSVDNRLGDYTIEIKGCRLAEDYEGKPIAIITYGFTNNGDKAAAFYTSITDEAYQGGIGLNECYFADDNANYDSDNQTKEIKTGASLDVEVAYTLNDTTTDIEVEVSEWISFSDKKLTKTFSIK